MVRKNKRLPANAMIVVERTKKRVFRYVPPKKIPFDSFEKEYGGRWLHILGLDLEGKLWPIERVEAVEGHMPTDLYMAVHCAAEVEEVFGMSIPLSKIIKIGLLVALCFGILVVGFLIATTANPVPVPMMQ